MNPSITLNPLQVVLQALAAVTFVASLSGGSGTITWSVDGIVGGNASVGTVDSSGNYVAPRQAGNHTVNATVLIGDTTVFANAAVNVSTTAPGVTVQTTAPTGTSYIGALVFDSTTAVLYVYTSTGWVVA
jgi:hypothetical protein